MYLKRAIFHYKFINILDYEFFKNLKAKRANTMTVHPRESPSIRDALPVYPTAKSKCAKLTAYIKAQKLRAEVRRLARSKIDSSRSLCTLKNVSLYLIFTIKCIRKACKKG